MMDLSASQKLALALIDDNEVVFAGGGNRAGPASGALVEVTAKFGWHGAHFSVAASTLKALERRGLVAITISPDSGMMARRVERGIG